MKGKSVGLLIICIALLIGFIVIMFNQALSDIVNTTCTHGETCPMWGTIRFQTSIGIGIMAAIILVGLYFLFFVKEDEKKENNIEIKGFNREDYVKVLDGLAGDEKKIFEAVLDSQGMIYQSSLVEKTGFSKVKVTRELDALESKGIIERKRRGMTNIIVLKR